MSELDDIEAVAGEYVLGTLDAAERAAISARRERDPALDRAIRRWEADFAPLMDVGAPLAPSADLFSRIEASLDLPEAVPAAPPGNVIALQRKLAVWRSIAIVTSAMAASLAFLITWNGALLTGPDSRLVAVLQKDANAPAFLVTVDLPNRMLTVKPLAGPAAPDKSYELWLVNASLGEPRSLGVISAPLTVSQNLRDFDQRIIEGSAVAVSLEPRGGSPTGKVTGPVLYSGPLLSASF